MLKTIRTERKTLPANVVEAPDPNCKPAESKYLAGSRFAALNLEILNQAIGALWTGNSTSEERARKQQTCLEAMAGIGPQDEIEGMLAAQMVACHAAAMECFRRAMIKEQPFDGRQQNLNFANKLSRTFALHMEALDKHRGKGQQKVTVEHVHVHQGGQAIVGSVSAGGLGAKSEEQPHAGVTMSNPANIKAASLYGTTISLNAIQVGVELFLQFDANRDEPEALVFAIADIVRNDIMRQLRLG